MFNLCVFTRALSMNSFMYTVLNAGIPLIYIVVSTLVLVMCVIRYSVVTALL